MLSFRFLCFYSMAIASAISMASSMWLQKYSLPTFSVNRLCSITFMGWGLTWENTTFVPWAMQRSYNFSREAAFGQSYEQQ